VFKLVVSRQMIPTLFNVPSGAGRAQFRQCRSLGTIPVVRSVKRKPHHSALRRGAGSARKKTPWWKSSKFRCSQAYAAVTRKKKRFRYGSEQDDKRFRLPWVAREP